MEEKKQLLLDIALKHFAELGYEATSTNRIVQQAGISKGMLFHYFSNKKQLYATVLELALKRIADFMASETTEPSADFFERILNNSHAKVKFFAQEPTTYHLLVDAFFGSVPEELEDVISKCRSQIAKHTSARFEDINISRLRPEVTPALAFDLVTGVADFLSTRFVQEHRNQALIEPDVLKEFVESMKPYLRIIETGVYQSTKGEN